MKQEQIEQGAWAYLSTVVGSDPNADPSLFEPDYNGFMAGADFVINGNNPVSEIFRVISFALKLREVGRFTQSDEQKNKAIRLINDLL